MRYDFVDSLRGLAVISMVIYHFLYDLYVVFGDDPAWHLGFWPHLWQQATVWVFILISGFVYGVREMNEYESSSKYFCPQENTPSGIALVPHWIRNVSKTTQRGFLLTGLGFGITLFTYLVIPSEIIIFGILNFFGAAMLLMPLIRPCLNKLPPKFGLTASFAIFLLSYNIFPIQIDLEKTVYSITLDEIYSSFQPLIYIFSIPLGITPPDFYSADYFPLLPWFFLYATGYYLGNLSTVVISTPPINLKLLTKLPLLSRLGRHSLGIYLMHQPIIFVWLFANRFS